MKYRKKPVVIEAFRYLIDEPPFWFNDAVKEGKITLDKTCCYIKTLEGTMEAHYQDYIIQGVSGEIYPCKPDIFEATYEEVKEWLSTDYEDPRISL